MSNPKRTLGLLGVLALTISACSNGGSASSAPASAAAPSAAAPSAAASAAPSAAAAEPVTLDWWHIATGDPGKADFQAIADAYTAANPEREDQHHGPRERGIQDEARGDPGGRLSRTSSSHGAVGPWPPRPTPACSRTSPPRSRRGRTRSTRVR